MPASDVALTRVVVLGNTVEGSTGTSSGGGIAVAEGNSLQLDASTIADNTVTRSAGGVAAAVARNHRIARHDEHDGQRQLGVRGRRRIPLGGGVYVDDDGEGAAVTSSTFAADTAGVQVTPSRQPSPARRLCRRRSSRRLRGDTLGDDG